jgi:hypothetical protein
MICGCAGFACLLAAITFLTLAWGLLESVGLLATPAIAQLFFLLPGAADAQASAILQYLASYDSCVAVVVTSDSVEVCDEVSVLPACCAEADLDGHLCRAPGFIWRAASPTKRTGLIQVP